MADSPIRQGPVPTSSLWGGKNPYKVIELTRIRFDAPASRYAALAPEDALSAAKSAGGVAVLAPFPTPLRGAACSPRTQARTCSPPCRACAALWAGGRPGAVAQVEACPLGPRRDLLGHRRQDIRPRHYRRARSYRLRRRKLLADAGGLKLFTLAGFVQREDERLTAAPGELKGVIGAKSTSFDGQELHP